MRSPIQHMNGIASEMVSPGSGRAGWSIRRRPSQSEAFSTQALGAGKPTTEIRCVLRARCADANAGQALCRALPIPFHPITRGPIAPRMIPGTKQQSLRLTGCGLVPFGTP